MQERDAIELQNLLDDIKDNQSEISNKLETMITKIHQMEKSFDESYNLSFLLTDIKNKLESIDLDSMFEFVDSINEEISSLSYKYKTASKANSISVYKLKTSEMPMYFRK